MSDQEAWHELCDLYLQEQEYSKAAYCMEELILHNPHSHLIYQRYAEIKYSQVIHTFKILYFYDDSHINLLRLTKNITSAHQINNIYLIFLDTLLM